MLGVPELNTASTISTYKGSTPEYDRVISEAAQKRKSTSKNIMFFHASLIIPFMQKKKKEGELRIQNWAG